MEMVLEEELKQAIVDLKYAAVSDMVKEALHTGMDPMTVLDSLKRGLDVVGSLYHNKEYFLSELFMAGETMRVALDVLMPALTSNLEYEDAGIIVMGSIEGDVHDFGKNIAKNLLTASGFAVHDLGVDISPIKFVEEAVRVNADVIGISAILSSTQPTSAEVVAELKARGLREKIKVILGGTGVENRAIKEYGVDAAVNDATEGVNIIKGWLLRET
jgi:5-methyltetrahydrofolate--homocysteine methyltransferase